MRSWVVVLEARARRRVVSGATAVVALVLFAAPAGLPTSPAAARAYDAPAATSRLALAPPWRASTPSQDLIAFLRSPAGLVGGGVLVLAGGVATAAFSVRHLQSQAQVQPRRSRKRRRRIRGTGDEKAAASLPGQTVIASILASGSLLLPLIFTIAWSDVFALPKTIGLWLLAAIVLVVLVGASLRGGRPLRAGPIDTALVLFVLLNGAATVMSADRVHSLVGERLQYQGLVTMSAYAVLFVAARYAMTEAIHVRLLALALFVGGVIVALYAVAQQVGLDPIWSELFKGRVFSTMGQANALAAVLGTCLVMSLTVVARPTSRARWAFVVGIGLIGTAFVLTLSRGGYLGLAAGVAVGSLVLLRGLEWSAARRYVARGAAVVAGVVFAFVLLAVAWKPAGDLATRVVSRVTMIADLEESSNRIRLDLWAVSLHMAADKPFLGIGPDGYVLRFAEYRDEVLPQDRAEHLARFRPESPHSVYLAFASGAGLPALGAFFVVLAGTLWLGVRAALLNVPWEARLAIASLIAAATIQLVTNAFVTGEPASFAIWCIVLGTLAGFCGHLMANTSDPKRQ